MKCCVVNSVLCERVWSCSNLFLMMSRAGSTGTEVNNTETLQDVVDSLRCSVMSFMGSTKFCMFCI